MGKLAIIHRCKRPLSRAGIACGHDESGRLSRTHPTASCFQCGTMSFFSESTLCTLGGRSGNQTAYQYGEYNATPPVADAYGTWFAGRDRCA